jgi:uncharacterized protein (DUF2236 family)
LNLIPNIIEFVKPLAFEVIGKGLQGITGASSSLDQYKSPVGDPGLFGPQSIVWRVHANFSAMMVGGLSSLMVQALHPRALAAVWDHSNFRYQLKARLGRTALFVAATTYGSTELATQSILRVNAIHAKIQGIDLNGKAYQANDPDLLRWVHLVEVVSFLNAYQHLSLSPLTLSECNRYVFEMNKVGTMLGAKELPNTLLDLQIAIAQYESVLTFDQRTKETLRSIENYSVGPAEKPFFKLIQKSSFDILPNWLFQKLQKMPDGCLLINSRRLALQIASQPIQWMLDEQGVSAVARKRVQLQSRTF